MTMDSVKDVILSLNWIDFLVLASLFVGALVGRKRGMSQELLDLIQWVLIVSFGAMLCMPLGVLIDNTAHIGTLWSRVSAYLFVMVVFMVIFAFARKMVGEKLVGSDVFGGFEFYLGILAGIVRAACTIVALMALVNAKYLNDAEITATAKSNKDNYGNISIPSFATFQADVFRRSLSGRTVRRYLSAQLIPSSNVTPTLENSVGRERGRAVDDAGSTGR